MTTVLLIIFYFKTESFLQNYKKCCKLTLHGQEINNMMKYVGLSVGIKLETNKGQLSESDNNNNDS